MDTAVFDQLTTRVSKVCPICGKTTVLEVNANSLAKWRQGAVLVQDAFPDLSKDDREILMTGIDPVCWSQMWASDEEED